MFLLKKWKRKGKKDLLINTLRYFYYIGYLYFILMLVIASLQFMFNQLDMYFFKYAFYLID